MGLFCKCIFRICCEAQDDDDGYENVTMHVPVNNEDRRSHSYASANPVEGQGLISHDIRGNQRISHPYGDTGDIEEIRTPASCIGDDDNIDHDRNCCRPSDPSSPSIYDIIRNKLNRWQNPYGAIIAIDDNENNFPELAKDKKISSSLSPLRQAISFNTGKSSDFPCTINADEIVLPGSILQHQMAQQMMISAKTSTILANIDECVICMEPFDAANPRMPTLCSCGVNKTYFHLPCLYQWVEQSYDCPSCRTKITWEEF